HMDRAILAARSVDEITSTALNHVRDLIPCISVTVSQTPASEPAVAASAPSFITVPLRANGDVIGAIDLATAESQPFTSEHLEIAQEVADSLAVAIRHAQLNEELEGQNVYLKEELERAWNFQEIVGSSRAMQDVFQSVEMVARTDATVLLL